MHKLIYTLQLVTSLLLIFTCVLEKNAEASPYVFQLDSDPGLHSVELDFTLDFTYNPQNGLKVIEFGRFYTSTYYGYADAYPNHKHPFHQANDVFAEFGRNFGYQPVYIPGAAETQEEKNKWNLYQHIMRNWYQGLPIPDEFKEKLESPSAMIFVGNRNRLSKQHIARKLNPGALLFGVTQSTEPISDILRSKALSTLLDDPEIQRFRPEQVVTHFGMTQNAEAMEKLRTQIAKFPGNKIIIKGANGTRGNAIFATEKSNIIPFLNEIFQDSIYLDQFYLYEAKEYPIVIQSYHPTNIRNQSPVGRASFNIFYDARTKRIIIYPLIMYWKTFSRFSTPRQNGIQLHFDDKSGLPVDESLRSTLFQQLADYMKVVFLKAAAINEHGLSVSNPITLRVLQLLAERGADNFDALVTSTYRSNLINELAEKRSLCITTLKGLAK